MFTQSLVSLRHVRGLTKWQASRPIHFSKSTASYFDPKQFDYGISDTHHSATEDTRIASVALVGAPNAGKSSLSNSLIRNRISAVSRKLNTTRGKISAAYTEGNRQLIFWDMPGVIEQRFVRTVGSARKDLASAWGAAADADIAALVIDTTRSENYWKTCAALASELVRIRRSIREHNQDISSTTIPDDEKLLLVLNKADITRPKPRLLEAVEFFQSNIDGYQGNFDETVYMVSAKTGRGVDKLREALLDRTKPGPFEVSIGETHCEEDLEIVRQHLWEKILHCVHNEVPYSISFENEEMSEKRSGALYVSETLRVKNRRHISFLVGPKGATIKWITTKASESASEALGRPVRVDVRVAASN